MGNLTHHPHDKTFINASISPLPWHIKKAVERKYSRVYTDKGRFEANLWLLDTNDRIGGRSIRLASNDGEICDFAAAKARQCGRIADDKIKDFVEQVGFDFPEETKGGITEEGAIERTRDDAWWRRQARCKHGRNVEGVARDLDLVNLRAGKYVSDESLDRRKQQRSRNLRTLEACMAVNELGQRYTLAELSELSVSNPAIRRSELMTRMVGFERIADDLDHVAEFYTLTCPSRFHSHTYGKNNSIHRNKAYESGLSPKDAADYLQKVWARTRAAFARRGVYVYGFRVAEPHHDGCPHWHLLLFMAVQHRDIVSEVFEHYAMQDTPEERGASKYRFKAVPIDKSRGSATGYIAKYIAKNIDAYGLESDLYGQDPREGAMRVDAWASTWGIRQFQQIGGPTVGVWRELRRLNTEDFGAKVGLMGLVLEEARAAADAGDWAGYVTAMDGLKARKLQPIKLSKAGEMSADTGEVVGELKPNKYGEDVAGRVTGVTIGNVIFVTRCHEWKIEKITREVESDNVKKFVVKGFDLGFGFDLPWTCVNNCTGVDDGRCGHEKSFRGVNEFIAGNGAGNGVDKRRSKTS